MSSGVLQSRLAKQRRHPLRCVGGPPANVFPCNVLKRRPTTFYDLKPLTSSARTVLANASLSAITPSKSKIRPRISACPSFRCPVARLRARPHDRYGTVDYSPPRLSPFTPVRNEHGLAVVARYLAKCSLVDVASVASAWRFRMLWRRRWRFARSHVEHGRRPLRARYCWGAGRTRSSSSRFGRPLN
jgi:hypothetical protein